MTPKHKALNRIEREDSVKPKNERRVAHKAIGGTLYFSNPKSTQTREHNKRVKEWHARGKLLKG